MVNEKVILSTLHQNEHIGILDDIDLIHMSTEDFISTLEEIFFELHENYKDRTKEVERKIFIWKRYIYFGTFFRQAKAKHVLIPQDHFQTVVFALFKLYKEYQVSEEYQTTLPQNKEEEKKEYRIQEEDINYLFDIDKWNDMQDQKDDEVHSMRT